MVRWTVLSVLVAAIVSTVRSGALGAGSLPVTDVVFWLMVAIASIVFLYNLLCLDKRYAK